MERFGSWGRYPAVEQQATSPFWRDEVPRPVTVGGTVLAHGLGRSYGDCCLNAGGTVISTRHLDRLIAFDEAGGVLACEAGVTLAQVLERFAPRGWFPPVVPGTKHVTIGGAIANDIHGKNHHRAGTFGRHVRRLELLRSSGERIACCREERPELFAATVGGLGLTGLITRAELQLRPIPSERIDWETVPFGGVEEFFPLSAGSDAAWEYTVAWVDCLATGRRLGRGLLFRGNHAPGDGTPPRRPGRPLAVPFDLPGFTLNRLTVAAFNGLYRLTNRLSAARRVVHYEPFFFPLDGVERWNRIYGRAGFLQFQCVVPFDRGSAGIRAVLEAIARSRQGSFLAVLKTFGDLPSPGLLSFPRPGVTLALDFPFRGRSTLALLAALERLVADQGGALYPAKDACMAPATFAAAYPRWRELEALRDPAFSSSLWRRVTGASVPRAPAARPAPSAGG
jgi:FAD/FMN-containing dehydrogenase